jgi:hypothetical protein
MTSILASSRQQTRLTAATLSPPVEVAGVINRCGKRRNCVSDLPLLLDAQDLAEVDARTGVNGAPSPAGGTAKRALWACR